MTDKLSTSSIKQLRRSNTDRMIAGVCGGWARLLGVDAAILRIGLVASCLFGLGVPIVLYGACWILMPAED